VWSSFGEYEAPNDQGKAQTPETVRVWFHTSDLLFGVNTALLVPVGKSTTAFPPRSEAHEMELTHATRRHRPTYALPSIDLHMA